MTTSKLPLSLAVLAAAVVVSYGQGQGGGPPDIIATVAPSSGAQGDTINLTVTFEDLGTPPIPPAAVAPSAVAIGPFMGTNIIRDGLEITAEIMLPADAELGLLPVSISFPGPENTDVTFTEDSAFEIVAGEGGGVTPVVFVDHRNQAGPWDGATWATAYPTVQEGIDAAAALPGTAAVWVAAGSYLPPGADRSATFLLPGGVILMGGFAGTEADAAERDLQANLTRLSGDLGVVDDDSDNAFHVITATGNGTLDGFIISGGRATGDRLDRLGGGMYNDGVSPNLRNCIFSDNRAGAGGAIYNYNGSSARISDCVFTDNLADNGGAVLNRDGSHAEIQGCQFVANHANWRGGAIYIDYGSDPIIRACSFVANTTNGNGGAIYTDDIASQLGGTDPQIRECGFDGNQADFRGGAIANFNDNTRPVIADCSFDNNVAGQGGGAIANDFRVQLNYANLTFSNNSGGTGAADIDSDDSSTATAQAPAGRSLAITPARAADAGGVARAGVFLVDAGNGGGTEDGSTWGTAFSTVQAGIDAASASGGGDVWVAAGVYYIHGTPLGTVQLQPNVQVYGGFAGTESMRSQRDWLVNETILDGRAGSSSEERVVHVVTGASDAVLDGFTVREGNAYVAREPPPARATSPEEILTGGGANGGGGLLAFQTAPTVRNCLFTDNVASKGGAVYVMVATSFPAAAPNPAPTFSNCVFRNNHASERGGAVQNDLGSAPTFSRCVFTDNSSEAKGGAMYNDFGSSPELRNCLVAGNSAVRASGIGCDGSSSPTLMNCTVTGNLAADVGAGLYAGSYGAGAFANEPVVVNSIVWGNENGWGGPADLSIWHADFFVISYSNIGNGFSSFGDGVIQADPLFVDAENGDYRLQSGSPCIGVGTAAGAPLVDLDGVAREGAIDLGAYAFVGAVEVTYSQAELDAAVAAAIATTTAERDAACAELLAQKDATIANLQVTNTAADSDGDGYTDAQEGMLGSDESVYAIELSAGWNLISLARVPDSATIGAVFGDAVLGTAWQWRAADSRYEVASALQPLRGCWVFAPLARTVPISLSR